MKRQVNSAIIGTGRIGSLHTRNLARNIPEANLVAVCDIRLEVAQAVAGELGIQRVVRDYHELLADKDIEAILIATSTDTHAFIMKDVAAAGKHIFCEKPLALDLASIEDALAAGVMFLDMTIHDFDMARFQVGEVQEVYAIGNVLVAPQLTEAGDVD